MIRGDAMRGVEAIGQLKAVLRRLIDLPRRTAAIAQDPLNRQLQEEFRNGTDPYGTPWAPVSAVTLRRRRAKKTPPPLTDTRTLRDGTSVEMKRANSAGLLLKTGAPYAYFHQMGFVVGRTSVPARRVLPQFGLPATWKLILRQSAQQAAREAVRG